MLYFENICLTPCASLFFFFVPLLLTRCSAFYTDFPWLGRSGTLFRVHKDLDSLIGMNCVCSAVHFAAAPRSVGIRLCIVHRKWKVHLCCLCLRTKPFELTRWADGVKCRTAVAGCVPGGEKSCSRWCYVRHVDLKIKEQKLKKKEAVQSLFCPQQLYVVHFICGKNVNRLKKDSRCVLVSNSDFEKNEYFHHVDHVGKCGSSFGVCESSVMTTEETTVPFK